MPNTRGRSYWLGLRGVSWFLVYIIFEIDLTNSIQADKASHKNQSKK